MRNSTRDQQGIVIRFPDVMHEQLRELAHRERTSINKLVVQAVERELQARAGQPAEEVR